MNNKENEITSSDEPKEILSKFSKTVRTGEKFTPEFVEDVINLYLKKSGYTFDPISKIWSQLPFKERLKNYIEKYVLFEVVSAGEFRLSGFIYDYANTIKAKAKIEFTPYIVGKTFISITFEFDDTSVAVYNVEIDTTGVTISEFEK